MATRPLLSNPGCNKMCCVSAWFGVSVLLGYTVVVNSADYLLLNFIDEPYSKIMFYLMPIIMFSYLLTLILLIYDSTNITKIYLRIIISYIIVAILLSIFPFIVQYINNQQISFILILIISFLISIPSALIMGDFAALFNYLPSQFLTDLYAGQALSGIIASGLRAITKGMLPNNNKLNGLLFFEICALLYLSFTFLMYWLKNTDIMKRSIYNNNHIHTDPYGQFVELKTSTCTNNIDLLDYEIVSHSKLHILHKIWKPTFCIFLDMVIVLTIYPSLLTNIQSYQLSESINHNEWMPVILLNEFHFFDYLSRQISSKYMITGCNQTFLLIVTILFVSIYVPVYLIYCEIIQNDIVTFLIVCIFAIIQGCIITYSFRFQQNISNNCNLDRKISARIMTFSLNVGCFVGTVIALLFDLINIT